MTRGRRETHQGTQAMIRFDIEHYELHVVEDIARRAILMANKYHVPYTMMEAQLDIVACHSNGCRLQLVALRDADDFNFTHDVFGIRRHINRETGKLEDCFTPRYAVHQ